MPKCYTYTVTSKITGNVVAEGSLRKCSEITGVAEPTLRGMAIDPDTAYFTSARRKYSVTRRPGLDQPLTNSKYYSVYDKRTDELIACGTSKECAKILGWKNVGVFRHLMSREKRTGATRYEYYSEPYYENMEDDML